MITSLIKQPPDFSHHRGVPLLLGACDSAPKPESPLFGRIANVLLWRRIIDNWSLPLAANTSRGFSRCMRRDARCVPTQRELSGHPENYCSVGKTCSLCLNRDGLNKLGCLGGTKAGTYHTSTAVESQERAGAGEEEAEGGDLGQTSQIHGLFPLPSYSDFQAFSPQKKTIFSPLLMFYHRLPSKCFS